MPTLFKPTYTCKATGRPKKLTTCYAKYRDANGIVCKKPLSRN